MKQKCQRCGYEWESKVEQPKQCPECQGRMNKKRLNFYITDMEIVEKIATLPKTKLATRDICFSLGLKSVKNMRNRLEFLASKGYLQKVITASGKIIFDMPASKKEAEKEAKAMLAKTPTDNEPQILLNLESEKP